MFLCVSVQEQTGVDDEGIKVLNIFTLVREPLTPLKKRD